MPETVQAIARGAALLLLTGVVACGNDPAANDPRARSGAEGPSTWRVVAGGGEGRAAFLARPGAAPDIVLWCRGDGRVTVRVHVFTREDDTSRLALLAADRSTAVDLGVPRIQGAVRDDGAMLAETALTLERGATGPLLAALSEVNLQAGAGRVWAAPQADPQAVLPGFIDSCMTPANP